MAVLGLQEAAERIETSKVDVWRAIQAGRLSAQRTEDGGIAIDPAELFRVFKPQQPDKRPVGQHATASLEASERPERIAQLSEPAGERAKADKAIAKCAGRPLVVFARQQAPLCDVRTRFAESAPCGRVTRRQPAGLGAWVVCRPQRAGCRLISGSC